MANRPAPASRNKSGKAANKKTVANMNKINKTVQSATNKMGARPSAVKNFLKKYSQGMR